MRTWINFKELRAKLVFEEVLGHYKVTIQRKGDQHHGFCPLPNHQGKGNSPSFSANLTRGIFHCFGCGAKGNVLEFAAYMSGVNPEDGDALRTVALELQQRFLPGGTSRAPKALIHLPPTAQTSPEIRTNVPLDFELKDLDASHPYVASRGISSEIARHFGIGFCSRGVLKGRLAVPLRNQTGQLLGYSGRVVDDATISEDNPRYRFPSRRERGGVIYEFRKGLFLYNGFRFQAPVDDLIVVEGFVSVWWLTLNSHPNTVALMGSDCSDEQAELIVRAVKPNGRIWMMPDGDEAGKRAFESVALKVAPHRFVRWVRLPAERQPTDLDCESLRSCLVCQ